jgi:hypothetical protein
MYLEKFRNMTEEEIAKFFGVKLSAYQDNLKRVIEKDPDLVGFGWKPNRLLVVEKFWLTLLKYKINLTYEKLGMLFDIPRATCHRYVVRITTILNDYQDEKIVLEKIKIAKESSTLLVDATEVKKKDLKNQLLFKMISIQAKKSNILVKLKLL